jgi:hypothetical protein
MTEGTFCIEIDAAAYDRLIVRLRWLGDGYMWTALAMEWHTIAIVAARARTPEIARMAVRRLANAS